MFKFGFILLIPTILASNSHGRHRPVRSNMDYTKDLGIKPGNIIFNFEQLRMDQPPQIEMRDESAGLYMHRRPQTTTTSTPVYEDKHMPKSIFDNRNDPFHRFSSIPSSVNNYDYHQMPSHVHTTPSYHQYNPIPSTPKPSPPPAPKWSDFPATFNKQTLSYNYEEPIETKFPAVPAFNHFQQPASAKFEQSTTHNFNRQNQPIVVDEWQKPFNMRKPIPPTLPTYTPEFKSRSDALQRKETENHHNMQDPQKHYNRGSHKFSWNDLVTEPSWNHESQVMTTTAAPAPAAPLGNKRPPVPTLTPWLDGF